MKMQYKVLVAACAAALSPAPLVVGNAFAVTPLACDTSSAAARVNTCAPEVKMFIAGSSALGASLTTVVPIDLFDTSTLPIIKVRDIGGTQGNAAGGAAAVSSWYGMSKAALTGGVSKRLHVVYNNNNGSAAGVSQVLAKFPPKDAGSTIAESDVVTVGPTKNVANTCVANAAQNAAASGSVPAMEAVDCTSHAPTLANIAISDTHPNELYKLYALATAKLTTLTSSPLAMQGFGVAVNPKLYEALVHQNVVDGLLPSSCDTNANTVANAAGVPGVSTASCQPSLRSVDYTSLVSKLGSIKSIATLVPSVTLSGVAADDMLTLARRDALSGTQASSNIHFADNSCANNVIKGKVVAGILGGQLDIVSNGTDATGGTNDSTSAFTVMANATTGNVKTALNATTGYAIGVLSLNPQSGTDKWKWIKIDGVSPNFISTDGGTTYTASYKLRQAMLDGSWKFQLQAFATFPTKKPKGSALDLYPALGTAVITGMGDSTLHDLNSIGYLDGAADVPATPKQSKVRRHLGNNCSPLIKAAS